MTELSDNLSLIDSISFSEISSKDAFIKNDLKEDEKNLNNFPVRCPNCSKIPRISADFENNSYFTKCDLNHKNEYNSFDLLLENSTKDFNNILCYECQNPNENISTMFYCEKCYLLFCSTCKEKHNKNTSHLDFISLDKIDNYCSKHNAKYKYFDNNTKKHLCEKCLNIEINKNKDIKENLIEISKYSNSKETIVEDYYKAKENLKIYNNISRVINEWLQNITNKLTNFLNSMKNYCLLQYKIVSNFNFKNSYEKYQNNFNAYFNYEIINNEKIDKLIRNINNNINYNYSSNDDISKVSQNIINILNVLGKKDTNIETKKTISLKEKISIPHFTKQFDDENKAIKVELMEKKRYELKSIIKTFICFDDNKYLILGFDTGEIKIYEEKEENKEKYLIKKLEINEFDNEINNLCEIDQDKIVASDIKKNIKIIQLKDNIKSYSIIQTIKSEEIEGNIYTISYLPIFSYYRNRHYFCISDNNNILVYKSNKRPVKLNPPGLSYDNQIQEYSIVQPTLILDDYNLEIFKEYNKKIEEHINEPLSFNKEYDLELKIKTNCILEINEKYCAAASSNSNCIKIFNMQNKFKEVITIPNIACNAGNCILSLSKDRKYLFVGTNRGLYHIYIDNFKKIKKFQLNQSILCLDFYKPECIVTCSLKNEVLYIKQYNFKNDFKDISKLSESKTYSNENINNIKVIKNRIFYSNNTNYLHYFQVNQSNKT